ncbi:neuropeptide F receptor-like [Limulus polyphemus]|uniref:Neuropeptide F receptor-like n=1 Tax=Limulus polyphemus TaxID=6850 RepID=A0ABM1BA66_LIMPO|nr:neuropeptide F receptor-like [Limulus polyphemus]
MNDLEMDTVNISTVIYDTLLNESMDNITEHLLKKLQSYVNNRAINDSALTVLLLAYVLLILAGASGNGLVCMAVARKPQMRTSRNVFIINLAISDLILCLFTMPFSLVEIVLKFWPLGVITCKLVASLQATSIFVSTISITAIALDRYKVIVYPTQESFRPVHAVCTLISIWTVALLLSIPLFIFRTVDHIHVGLPWLDSVDYCLERWPLDHGRAFYSVFSMIFQYVLPIVIVSVAYARICRKLKNRMATNCSKLEEKQERDKKRVQKTNILLISIALIFGISWLPLNILNIIVDFHYTFQDPSVFRIVFACCHMAGMSSACSNPFLYGWLNENFRKEFKDIFSTCYTSFSYNKRSARGETTESILLYSRANGNKTGRTDIRKYDTVVVTTNLR